MSNGKSLGMTIEEAKPMSSHTAHLYLGVDHTITTRTRSLPTKILQGQIVKAAKWTASQLQ